MTEETAVRRRPKQARSQQRVNHLLDTAAAVFAETGYEAATTNQIAARAQVPIGSLYQFFPNKQAILDALVERYIADLGDKLDSLFSLEAASVLPVTAIIGQIVDGLAAFDRAHAGFHAIFIGSSTTLQQSVAAHGMHTEIIHRADALLALRFPTLQPNRRWVGASAGVAIVKGMMPLAEPLYGLPHEQMLVELKSALLAYLRSFLLREGVPLPEELLQQPA
jgi:AcrR family transcriptional regulator